MIAKVVIKVNFWRKIKYLERFMKFGIVIYIFKPQNDK